MSITKQLLDEIRNSKALRRELVSEIATRLTQDPSIRVLILNSLISEVATKRDLEVVKTDVNKRIDDLNRRIDDASSGVNKRIDDLRADMRTYFFSLMGGILATIITVVITKLI